MIRITVELLPFGFDIGRKHLGTIDIANDGTGTPDRGNYKVRFSRKGKPSSTWKTDVVKDFPRKSKNVYDLMLRSLVGVVGPRNKRFIEYIDEELIDDKPLDDFGFSFVPTTETLSG